MVSRLMEIWMLSNLANFYSFVLFLLPLLFKKKKKKYRQWLNDSETCTTITLTI